jgi:hypothetical protein
MSRILKRPMFRGGGKVSSYGNGIATGLADGGMPGKRGLVTGPGGYAGETGGSILSNISNMYNNLTSPAINPKTGIPYTAAETQALLGSTKDELNTLLSFTPLARTGRGLNIVRSAYSKFPGFKSGLPSASKVKDFFTKSPQSSNTSLGPYKGTAPGGTDRFFAEKLRPMFQNTGAALKDLLGGAGKLKDYKTAIGVGGVGGGYGLKKMYEGFKERQEGKVVGIDGQSELTDDQLELKRLREELYNERKGISTEDSSDEYKETLVDKKARLKKTAEGYEELLGDGIKKSSIFDAMIEGGSRLYGGEGFGSAARAANTALNPIQNIKTAARKLALEEDISMNKALAIAAAKDTETSKKIRALEKGKYTDKEIADVLAGKKDKDLSTYIDESATAGYMQFVNDKIKPESVVVGIEDIGDVDTSKLKNGVHYIKDAFVLIEVENGKLKGQPTYLR